MRSEQRERAGARTAVRDVVVVAAIAFLYVSWIVLALLQTVLVYDTV